MMYALDVGFNETESAVCLDALDLDFKLPCDGSVDIVTVKRAFERMNPDKANELLASIEATLKPGGYLYLTVADHDRALTWIKQGQEYRLRLFGPGTYSDYLMKYKAEDVIKKIEDYGLVFEHHYAGDSEYPAFSMRFRKPFPLAARDYALQGDLLDRVVVGRNRGWRILEIGPGNFPLPYADTYVDIDPTFLDKIPTDKSTLAANLEEGLPWADKQFDFVYCAHVLEHTQDPVRAAAEISRVGKEGLIIMPSAYKESLFGYEEEDHLWEIFPPNAPGQPILFRGRNPEVVAIFDKDYQSVMCSMFRAGKYDTRERRVLRKWYRENEAKLDVIVHWRDSIPVQII